MDVLTVGRRHRLEFGREACTLLGESTKCGCEVRASLLATAHRGWMSLKDALAGSDPDGVLDAAEQGEDHAISEYQKALDEDISANLRQTLQRQLTDIKSAHDEVKRLRDAAN